MLYRKKNSEEFERVFKRNYTRLCCLAYRYLEDREEAKDLVNDVFEQMWKHYATLDIASVDAYLYRAVQNRCVNSLEHRKVKEAFYSSEQQAVQESDAEPNVEDKELLWQEIEAACRQLPEKTQYILGQCYFHNRKYKEVADELSITSDAVKKHIVKALKFLRATIKRERYE